MDVSVLWVPDDKAGERLALMHRIYARAAGADEGYFAHVSLGVYYGIDGDMLRRHTKDFVRETHPFTIQYEKLGLLSENVIALMARPEGMLTALHRRYHAALDAYADEWTSLAGGRYRPHSTMLHVKNGNARAFLDTVDVGFAPFDARIQKIALSRSYPDGRYELIDVFELI